MIIKHTYYTKSSHIGEVITVFFRHSSLNFIGIIECNIPAGESEIWGPYPKPELGRPEIWQSQRGKGLVFFTGPPTFKKAINIKKNRVENDQPPTPHNFTPNWWNNRDNWGWACHGGLLRWIGPTGPTNWLCQVKSMEKALGFELMVVAILVLGLRCPAWSSPPLRASKSTWKEKMVPFFLEKKGERGNLGVE